MGFDNAGFKKGSDACKDAKNNFAQAVMDHFAFYNRAMREHLFDDEFEYKLAESHFNQALNEIKAIIPNPPAP